MHLRKLPTEGPRVLQGPGENAGAVDIGDGLAAVFKIESHNHPSFIEPYQGAATGVGGIIRDIFTMGARPIALMNSLRFGDMDGAEGARTRRTCRRRRRRHCRLRQQHRHPDRRRRDCVRRTLRRQPAGECVLPWHRHAPMRSCKGSASGIGNPVYYVGSKTGRDGIHGATMASAEFDDKSAEKRPAVQVGDPFMEKLLLEACLELMQTDALIGVQDMGAAGLTCSTCEMGSRGGAGIEIDVMHVPQRETGMTAYEIMLSESQERMLLCVKKGREAEVEQIFEKWDLHAAHIGYVTSDGMMRVKDHGTVVAEIPNTALVDEAPVYDRPTARPAYLDEVRKFDVRVARRRQRPQVAPCRCSGRRRSPASAGSIASTTTWSARTRSCLPGMGAGVVADQGDGACAGALGGRQRPVLLPRSAPRRDAGGRRGGAERRVRRRHADRRHQLPELRQPRAARDHVAAGRGDRGHRRSVPRARRADHRRQRQPLQRDQRRGHLSDTDHRRRRRARRCVAGRRAAVSRGRRRHRPARRELRRARRQRISEGRPRPGEGRAARGWISSANAR